MPWVFLLTAIAAEVLGTLGLRAIADTAQPWSVALIAISYAVSVCFMALTLRHLNVGLVYAIWSGVGTASVAGVGAVAFGDRVTRVGLVGIALIVGGVVLLANSGSARHG